MWLLIKLSARGVDPQWWLPLCGALVAALALQAEAARAGDNLPQQQEQRLGRSTSTLEAVMPANENAKQPAAARRPDLPPARPPPARPVPEPLPIRPGTVRSAPGVPGAGEERRIPIRLDAQAMLGLNDLYLDPARGMFEQKDAAFERNPLQRDRLDLAKPEPEPIPARSRTKPSVPPPISRSGWFGEHMDLDLNDGISYRTNFQFQETNARLKIYGPIVKGHAGVGARLRGLQLGEHPVEMRARATKHLQDLQVRIEF